MRPIVFAFVFCIISFNSYSQSSDSLNAIEQQQEALRREQLRLQAKQDSLQKEQDRITAEKIKQQQTAQPTVTSSGKKGEHYNHTVLAFHPIFAVLGQADFSLEQSISKTSSLYLEIVYHDFNLRENATVATFMPGDWISYTGYRTELQFRYYMLPEAKALYKLYLAPHVYYKQDEVTRGEGAHYDNNNGEKRQYEFYNQYQAQAMGAGVNVGYQFQFLKHLTFDSSVGASYTIPLTGKSLSELGHLTLVNPYKEGMMLRMNISIGFAF